MLWSEWLERVLGAHDEAAYDDRRARTRRRAEESCDCRELALACVMAEQGCEKLERGARIG